MQGLFVNPPMLPEKYRTLHTSYEDNSGALPIVSGDDMKFILKEVAGDTVLDDVSQFPVHYAPASLEGFPRTYTINTNLEALRDDGTVLATVLRELSIPVKRDCMAGLPHYFWCFPVQRSGQVFRELLVAGIQWVVNA